MPGDPRFDQCNAEQVFAEVARRLATSELQTLWKRLHDELNSGGPSAVGTYLDSEFAQVVQNFHGSLNRVILLERSRSK